MHRGAPGKRGAPKNKMLFLSDFSILLTSSKASTTSTAPAEHLASKKRSARYRRRRPWRGSSTRPLSSPSLSCSPAAPPSLSSSARPIRRPTLPCPSSPTGHARRPFRIRFGGFLSVSPERAAARPFPARRRRRLRRLAGAVGCLLW